MPPAGVPGVDGVKALSGGGGLTSRAVCAPLVRCRENVALCCVRGGWRPDGRRGASGVSLPLVLEVVVPPPPRVAAAAFFPFGRIVPPRVPRKSSAGTAGCRRPPPGAAPGPPPGTGAISRVVSAAGAVPGLT